MSLTDSPSNNSCPVLGTCRDDDALRVMEEFRSFYEAKLSEIDLQGGGDCLQLKLKVQRRWIEDLTEQTQMMARVLKDLEDEATNRVRMLEDKLRQTSKCAYEVMKRYQTYNFAHNLDPPFQKVFYLESDVKNLLEFVRRVREDNRWSINGLHFYDVSYKELFGQEQCECSEAKPSSLVPYSNGINSTKKENPSALPVEESTIESEGISEVFEQLKKKTEEYEILRQSMLDMRGALTEEVACKHDMISALKKDIQRLEERCVQADKQTAFKDDIIKELRKEIKQLKLQKSEKVSELERKLEEVQHKITNMRPCVQMTTKHTTVDMETCVEKELETELQRKDDEIGDLRCKCKELGDALARSRERAENLQKAVDLYVNSINVLEAAEERAKMEIEQQKVTIVNLQDALVGVKQELDELRQTNQQEMQDQQGLMNILCVNLTDLEEKNCSIDGKLSMWVDSYKQLQDYNFGLEVEHFNSLQDLALLETQLYKYQTEFKCYEAANQCFKRELKKLRQQNAYYEQVVDCFKSEMAIMSEQLIHLQEILNLSNISCKEENCQLYNAVVELQRLSEKLQSDLNNTKQKVFMENQKNQCKDAKIDELQVIIGQKNADLHVHDEAINDMKMKLESLIIENHELQTTIGSLNATVMQLQCAMQAHEMARQAESCHSKIQGEKSLSKVREDLRMKNKTLEKLQQEYVEQYEMVKSIQKEMERIRAKNREKNKLLKVENEELKNKLSSSEEVVKDLKNQVTNLNAHVAQLNEKECSREHDLLQSRQIILELRQTMIELNGSLAESELRHMALAEEYQQTRALGEREHEDLYLSCRCEIALYKRLADNFKESALMSRRKLCEMEEENKLLSTQLKQKELIVNDFQKKIAQKENETCGRSQELAEKLGQAQEEEKRLREIIRQLRDEIQTKIEKACDNREGKYVTVCCYDDEDAEDIMALKNEIENLVQNLLALNSENDKLLKEVSNLRDEAHTLEERNCIVKQRLENENDKLVKRNKCLQSTLDTLQAENRTLKQKVVAENAKLLEEITCLQSAVNALEERNQSLKAKLDHEDENVVSQLACLQNAICDLQEKNRQVKQRLEQVQSENQHLKVQSKILLREKETCNLTIRNLETELADTRSHRDDVCAESKCVVSNVRAWLDEQRRINEAMKTRTQCYCDTIKKLQQENESLLSQTTRASNVRASYRRTFRPPTPPPRQQDIWCLGSQGTSPRDSPGSCHTCSVDEWYSPNYRDDDETDDECKVKLEATTLMNMLNGRGCNCSTTKDLL